MTLGVPMFGSCRYNGKVSRVVSCAHPPFFTINSAGCAQLIHPTALFLPIILLTDPSKYPKTYVNLELNLSHSKYIYAALANTHLKEFGWHRHNTLFSKNPIPYKNLLDASRQLCDLSFSNKENTEFLKKAIWLTDAVVSPLVHQWRIHLKIAE